MKLDEKYFVPFLAILAIVAALIIVFFTISNRQGRREAFEKKITAQDSLRFQPMPKLNSTDSLSVSSFRGRYVILDFWAPWTSSFTTSSHRQLAKLQQQYPAQIEVLAAVVEDKSERTREFISRNNYSFHYVEGTDVFNTFKVPGVPTQLVYNPDGRLISIFTGYADSARLDSLQTILKNGF